MASSSPALQALALELLRERLMMEASMKGILKELKKVSKKQRPLARKMLRKAVINKILPLMKELNSF